MAQNCHVASSHKSSSRRSHYHHLFRKIPQPHLRNSRVLQLFSIDDALVGSKACSRASVQGDDYFFYTSDDSEAEAKAYYCMMLLFCPAVTISSASSFL